MHDKTLLVPRRLDAPPKFLLWDFDTVAVGIAGIGIGILVNSFWFGAISGVGFIYCWSKLRSGRHPGYGLHWLYWHLPLKFFKRTPDSCRRFFVG